MQTTRNHKPANWKKKEKWKLIEGYHGLYSVSDMGRVRCNGRTKPPIKEGKKPKRTKKRLVYPHLDKKNNVVRVCLNTTDRRTVQILLKYLVADHWLMPRIKGSRVTLKRTTDVFDCSIYNLRETKNTKVKGAKLLPRDVLAIRKELVEREGEWGARADIAKRYEVSDDCIKRIAKRETWKTLDSSTNKCATLPEVSGKYS